MEPLFKALVVALVPQPRQIPPAPFGSEDLQRVFMDVTRDHPYQSFGYLPGGMGAQLTNGPEDSVMLQPGLFQVQAQMDGAIALTTEAATDKAMSILRTASARLKVEAFLQCAIKVVALVSAPGPSPDAKAFVSERLMRGNEQAEIMASGYFGGGVRFRRVDPSGTGEDSLGIEPFIQDNTFLFVTHDVAKIGAPHPIDDLDHVSSMIEDAFKFIAGPTMSLLNT